MSEERRGYRHGTHSRTLTTSLGPTRIVMPRARLDEGDGTTREWQSRVVPRYQRRTERFDEAILGLYLAGANTRRVRSALAPLHTTPQGVLLIPRHTPSGPRRCRFRRH
ncbi:MAG: hypothetical protein FJ148_25425 [Deltaproteobacteria bacterium]|nr:hypothetical protein [Deltaproteobacteria bacterium]